MRIVRSLDEDKWRHFVESQPASNVFHTPEMFQVFARAKGHQPTLWAGTDNSGQILALLLPVQITLRDGLLRRLTTRAVVYGSVLYDPSPAGEEALATLLRTYAQEADREVLFTELRNLLDLSDLQPVLNEHGFVYEEHLNYLIDLSRPVEEVLQSIGRRTRKKIRKGSRDALVQITEVTDQAELDHWYDTLRKTYRSARVPLADRSLFEAAFDELYPKGMAKCLLAKVNSVMVACSVELPYKDTIYGWYGGSDRDYSQYYPNEMLVWHILKWGARNGYRVYDFGGAGKPDEEYGVRDFKAKFGGELVCFGRNTCVHAPFWLRLSELGYNVYRRLVWHHLGHFANRSTET